VALSISLSIQNQFCSRLRFLETRNRSIKDGLDGLSLDSAF
jgi:hypothetical protein